MRPDIEKFLAALKLRDVSGPDGGYIDVVAGNANFVGGVIIDGCWTGEQLAEAISAAVDARVSELLAANNAEVERRRKAEAELAVECDLCAERTGLWADAKANVARLEAQVAELECEVKAAKLETKLANGYVAAPRLPSEEILRAISVELAVPRAGAARAYHAAVDVIQKRPAFGSRVSEPSPAPADGSAPR